MARELGMSVAAMLVACASPPSAVSPSSMPTDCERALRALISADLANAPALPRTCTIADAVAALPALGSAEDNAGTLGLGHAWKWRGVPGDDLTLWHDGTHVVAIDLARPTLDWSALRTVLGEPEAKFDYIADVAERKAALWVYPARGLAIYTAGADSRVTRFMAFAPTSAVAFHDTLARSLAPTRERPDRD